MVSAVASDGHCSRSECPYQFHRLIIIKHIKQEIKQDHCRPPCEHWSHCLPPPSLLCRHRHRRCRSVKTSSSRLCSRASSQSAGRSGRSTAVNTWHIVLLNRWQTVTTVLPASVAELMEISYRSTLQLQAARQCRPVVRATVQVNGRPPFLDQSSSSSLKLIRRPLLGLSGAIQYDEKNWQ